MEEAAIDCLNGRFANARTDNAHDVFAQLCTPNSVIRRSDCAERALLRGWDRKSRVEHDHEMLAMLCTLIACMVRRADEAREARAGQCETSSTEKAHADVEISS